MKKPLSDEEIRKNLLKNAHWALDEAERLGMDPEQVAEARKSLLPRPL